LLSADLALAPYVTQLQPIQAAANSGDVAGMLALTPTFFGNLASTLAVEATQQFTVSLSASLIDVQPGQSKDLTVQLANTGPDPVTLTLSAPGLPNGVTATFGQTQVTLVAGATASVDVTLSNTLVSAKVFTLEVTAAALVVQETATAAVSIRPAVADVLAVTVSPTAVAPGDSVAVTAQVFNAANVARSVLAHLDILDTANNVVSTLPEVPVSIVPGSGNVTLDLGQVSTAGLAAGLYSLDVSLRASDDSPLPGLAAQTLFAVGQLVTATVAASAPVVAPGTSTESTTITVANPVGTGTTITVGAVVPGTSDPYLAGMPNGSAADGGDSAPAQSPILVRGLPLATNDVLTFSVNGSVNYFGGTPTDPPDGGLYNGSLVSHFVGAQNGISNITAPTDSLLGVFLGPDQPSLAPAPAALDFSANGNVPGGLNYLTLAPKLQQLFFIGDGRTDTSQIQQVVVPAGATRLVLATMDGTQWSNNTGSLNVHIKEKAVSVVVTHDLPSSGYNVDATTISPAATSSSASQVVWNTSVPSSAAPSLFQLGGTVDGMAPGEVRTISLGTTVTTATSETVTASSEADFSGTQGQGGWYYGYYATPASADTFTQLPVFNGYNWQEEATLPPYTQLWSSGGFPGGPPYGPTHWAARRWVSDVAGTVSITGRATPALYGNNGDGMAARVYVDGVQVWSYVFQRFDTSTATFQLTQSVQVGSTIDFVIDPLNTINSDAMTFIGSITGNRASEVQTLHLPALTVAAEHVISLGQAVQSADRGGQASYTLKLTNPYFTDQAYSLSSDGLGGLTSDLPSSVVVPAGQTISLPLDVTVPPGTTPGAHVFQVLATTAGGAVDSVEGQLTVSPAVALKALAVHVDLQPVQATAGQGTPTTFTLRVTNEGDAVDTYNLSVSGLPAGITAKFSQPSVTVPPGLSNYRDVTVTLTPVPGTPATDYPFTVTATSTTNGTVMATAAGTVTVVPEGVQVTVGPVSGAPGSTFQMTVTNTGQVADTFNLALTGPAAVVANLGTATVSLAPGASQVFPITTGAVNFADPGDLSLTAMATAQLNPAVQAGATADLSIPTTQGMTADSTTVTVHQVGPTSFVLLVHNTGNTEDAYSATVTGVSGPITASLLGLDGQSTQTIPIFRLPGLFTGAILVQADVLAPGQGTVSVQVQSLGNQSITQSATATINAVLPPTLTVNGGMFTYDSQSHSASGSVTGFNGANLGTPTFTYTDANGVTTSNPPINAGTYTVTASFAGNANYTAGSSTATIVIKPVTPTVVVKDAGGTYNGGTFPASATATGVGSDGTLATSPNAALTFTYYAGSSVNGTGTPAAPVTPGTYTVVAHYAVGANYTSADSAPVTFSISKATPTVTVTGGTLTYDGQPHPATGSVTGINGANLGTPTFAYTDANNVTTSSPPVNAGTYAVTASFPGNANYTPASNTAAIVISNPRKNVGILLLDPSGKGALTDAGNGNISVTGGGAIAVNSSSSQAAIVTGSGNVSAAEIDAMGTVATGKGTFQGVVKNSAPPIPDLLRLLPPLTPAMFVTVSTSTLNVTGNGQVTLQPGRYVGGIKISGQAQVTLAAGVYYLDGGGFSVSGQATVVSAGGVLLDNVPRSISDTISFTGQGSVTLTGWLGDLSGLAPGVSLDNAYQGIAVLNVQRLDKKYGNRTFTALINLTGQGKVTITGSVYAPGATIKVAGNGNFFLQGDPRTKIGAHLIASDLEVTGNGGVTVDASNNSIALW
jgi:uncharacterized membrane protein